MNINDIKPGTFFKSKETTFMALEIEYMENFDYYLITYKQLDTGKIRTEPFKSYSVLLKHLKEIEGTVNDEKIITKHTCKPVYYYFKNGKMHLDCKTKGTNIYYTYDNEYIEYITPIEYKNRLIKAYSIKDGYNNSSVMKFDYNELKTNKRIIYLSPSNQKYNKGFEDIGYNTEFEIMNRLADKIETILLNNNFTIYRNDPNKKIIDWGKESKEKNCCLHLALHSNGSNLHLKKGMEIYVYNYENNMYSLATSLIDNLYKIYPYKEETLNYRGVKEGLVNIGEVNLEYVRNGILFEIAYHDNREDAFWIINNLDEIADNISKTLIDYYNNFQ